MRFELRPNNRGVSDEDLLADLRQTAERLGKQTLTAAEYSKHGSFSSSAIRRRPAIGSWPKALGLAGLGPSRSQRDISDDALIGDVKRVAETLGRNTLTHNEYDQHGQFGSGTIAKRLGWFNALDRAGLVASRTWGVTEEQYFRNLEQLWLHYGRQPYYREVQKPLSAYSAKAYDYKFGGWRKALEAFVTWVNTEDDVESPPPEVAVPAKSDVIASPNKTPRQIPERMRFRVMQRDDFRCQACGNSPALTPGLALEVDHIIPWSKNGPTIPENLQTLCWRCNSGKGDLIPVKPGK